MPVPRKSQNADKPINPPLTPRPLKDWASGPMPRRIVIYVVIRDESGSMSRWRQQQGEFIPAVAAHLLEVGGPKVGDMIYLSYCVVSGGVVTTEFAPLSKSSDPEFTPDGQTPIGKALSTVAEKCQEFLEARVFPGEVTVRNFEVLLVSDLKATGETKEETNAGVEKFLEMARKYRAKVNLVGPSPEEMDQDLPGKLDVSERGVKYLDADPKSILDVTFDSLLSASRTSLGGSNPTIRIR